MLGWACLFFQLQGYLPTVGNTDMHLSVEAPGAAKCFINRIDVVGGAHNHKLSRKVYRRAC